MRTETKNKLIDIFFAAVWLFVAFASLTYTIIIIGMVR
jgi:hypothetical protein